MECRLVQYLVLRHERKMEHAWYSQRSFCCWQKCRFLPRPCHFDRFHQFRRLSPPRDDAMIRSLQKGASGWLPAADDDDDDSPCSLRRLVKPLTLPVVDALRLDVSDTASSSKAHTDECRIRFISMTYQQTHAFMDHPTPSSMDCQLNDCSSANCKAEPHLIKISRAHPAWSLQVNTHSPRHHDGFA